MHLKIYVHVYSTESPATCETAKCPSGLFILNIKTRRTYFPFVVVNNDVTIHQNCLYKTIKAIDYGRADSAAVKAVTSY